MIMISPSGLPQMTLALMEAAAAKAAGASTPDLKNTALVASLAGKSASMPLEITSTLRAEAAFAEEPGSERLGRCGERSSQSPSTRVGTANTTSQPTSQSMGFGTPTLM